jgi:hypothetical protein
MVPEFYLLYLWKGINPPSFQHHTNPSLGNILLIGANVGLFSIPIITGCLYARSLRSLLPSWWGKRSTAFVFVGLIVFVVGLRTVEWPTLGGGIIVKAGSLMGTFGTPFILVLVYFGLLVAILFSMSSDINAILTASFIGPFLLSSPMFQRYFEPSLLVSLFLFSDIKTAKSIFTESVLIANFIFYIIILMIGLIYYGLLGQGAPLTG